LNQFYNMSSLNKKNKKNSTNDINQNYYDDNKYIKAGHKRHRNDNSNSKHKSSYYSNSNINDYKDSSTIINYLNLRL